MGEKYRVCIFLICNFMQFTLHDCFGVAKQIVSLETRIIDAEQAYCFSGLLKVDAPVFKNSDAQLNHSFF